MFLAKSSTEKRAGPTQEAAGGFPASPRSIRGMEEGRDGFGYRWSPRSPPRPSAPAPLPVLGAHALAARRRQHSLFPATLVHDSHVITTL